MSPETVHRQLRPVDAEVVTHMPECPDDIDDLFDTAATETVALDELEKAVAMLRAANEAKVRLQRLSTNELRGHLQRRAGEAS